MIISQFLFINMAIFLSSFINQECFVVMCCKHKFFSRLAVSWHASTFGLSREYDMKPKNLITEKETKFFRVMFGKALNTEKLYGAGETRNLKVLRNLHEFIHLHNEAVWLRVNQNGWEHWWQRCKHVDAIYGLSKLHISALLHVSRNNQVLVVFTNALHLTFLIKMNSYVYREAK